MQDHERDSDSENKRFKERSPSPAIKSTAVVKYTTFQNPVAYSRLQCNTDLNLPPSNWAAHIDSYGLKQIVTREPGLASFRMAHMFPECVGDVDVVSGAECIKTLLKLPYHPNSTVSMMVHRVENTLLLDEFDVYNYLMKSEWSWLKDFFYENILKTMSEQERMAVTLAPKPSSARQLAHKFLSHSVADPECDPKPQELPVQPICVAGPFLPEPEPSHEPADPPTPPTEHLYNRNVLWTFEDIHMLIGSDLPIFGDKDRPCVSLRLRDASEPINVLTGIDYWLDNLMSNVPEVLMCYHLDGIVQRYEPMKTEDLPNMENSKFSPKVIRNVAQNILSFLKSNATKSGHTYWLFKGPHDDVVKLYDLTSLCPDNMDNPFTTPVAILLYRVARNMRLTNRSKHVKQLVEHVIELLKVESYPQIIASSHYMLADLYLPCTTNPADPGFKDETSDSDEDPEFSDSTSPQPDKDSTSPNSTSDKDSKSTVSTCEKDNSPDTKDAGADNNSANDDGDKDENSLAVQIRGLTLTHIGDRVSENERDPKQKPNFDKGLGTGVPVRCGRALKHALNGLHALHHITITKCKEEERERLKQQIINEEQYPKMANPYEPISMEYEPISKEHQSRSRRRKRERKLSEKSTENCLIEASNVDKNAILIRKEKTNKQTLYEPPRDDNFAWKLHLKTLLYEKICLAYATLAEYSYANEQYGFSLKYIDMASKCQKLLSNMIIKSRVVDASCLIGRVGDNYFQLSKNWHRLDHLKRQFDTDHETDARIRTEIDHDLLEETDQHFGQEFDLDIKLPSSDIESMLLSCTYYQRACKNSDKRMELQRRLASVRNELAVRYMNDGQQTYAKYAEETDPKSTKAKLLFKQFNTLSKKSLDCLDQAMHIFESVQDVPNLALLYCNKGRYMRFRAHCSAGEFKSDKRDLYSQAEDLYLTALKLLGPRETCGAAPVHDLVSWELSCHLYTKAALMQDYPTNTVNEASEVAEAFKYALKYCHLNPGPRQYLYQFRAAMIHYRLGSLYHSLYRRTEEDGPKRRSLLNLCRTNYEQATNMFAALEDAIMFLTVTLERVAVMEAQAQVSPNLKLKSLQTSVQLLRQCHSMMKVIKLRDPDQGHVKLDEHDENSLKNEHSLLSLFENRLHFILKSIIQYCRSKPNKDYEKLTIQYKKLYCVSLRIRKSEDTRTYAGSICEVLEGMDEVCKEFE